MREEYFERERKRHRRRDLAKDEANSFQHPHPKYWSQQWFKQKGQVHTRELETKGTIDVGETQKVAAGTKRLAGKTKTPG